MTWIVAYDIACPRRWRRLYRLVKEYGVRLQWSVFVVTQPRFRPGDFLAKAARIIDAKADDVRVYRLAGKVSEAPARLDPLATPAGIHWSAPARARRPAARGRAAKSALGQTPATAQDRAGPGGETAPGGGRRAFDAAPGVAAGEGL